MRWIVTLALSIAVNAAALWLGAKIVSGISFQGGPLDLIVLALIFGIVNTVVKPIVQFLSLPFHIVTLGISLLLVNAALLGLTAWLSSAYTISGVLAALIGAFVIGMLTMMLNGVVGMFVREPAH